MVTSKVKATMTDETLWKPPDTYIIQKTAKKVYKNAAQQTRVIGEDQVESQPCLKTVPCSSQRACVKTCVSVFDFKALY